MATVNNMLNLMASKINISNNVKNVTDMSAVINTCTNNINKTTNSFVDLSNHITNLSTTNNVIYNIVNSIDKLNENIDKTDAKTKKAGSGFSKIGGAVKNAFSSISFDKLKTGMDYADNYIKSSNSLARINDNKQTQAVLQNKVNSAANRSYTSYTDMVGAVSNIGTLDTFKSNDETIAFTELLQKSLKSDGSDQSLSDVTNSMADGKIMGDEFDSLIGSAPSIGKAMSKSTGMSIDQLRKMADQGLITADSLKKALFASGDEINTNFNNQPKTFAEIWEKIKNSAMNALNPLMQAVSNLLNNPVVQTGVNVIISLLGLVSQAISNLISFITENWSIIQPIFIAIGIFLAVTLIQYLIGVMLSIWATIAPILIIIGLIAIVISIFQLLGVSVGDIFGFIGGIIGVTIAGIWNLFLGLFDLILGIISFLVNPFIDFANFFGNLFTNPISSIIYLFQGLADSILGIVETIASALDKVFGSHLADTVGGWRSGLKDMADEAVKKYAPNENYQEVTDKLNLSSDTFGLKRMGYGEQWENGKNTGLNMYKGANDLLGSLGKTDKGYNYKGFLEDDNSKGTPANPMNIKGTGANGSVNVDMEKEDLGYLKELAEKDYIANISTNTLAPNISVNFGDVHETADVNQLFERIQTILREQIAVAPEGVY